MATIILEEEEASFDQQHLDYNNKYYAKKLIKYSKNSPLKPVLEPVPCAEHIFCAVCEVKFDNYLEHINS